MKKWSHITVEDLQLLLNEKKTIYYISLLYGVNPNIVDHKCKRLGLICSTNMIDNILKNNNQEKTYKELFEEIDLKDVYKGFKFFVQTHNSDNCTSDYKTDNITMLFNAWIDGNYCLLYLLYISCLNWVDDYAIMNEYDIALKMYEKLGM